MDPGRRRRQERLGGAGRADEWAGAGSGAGRRLAEPFKRLAADRTGSDAGSGLGLSIVAAIVTAHGGHLDLRPRPEGGLRVTVHLPAGRRGGGGAR
ncbi:ATP-binding protein [Micromonospora sp. CPCC 206061]